MEQKSINQQENLANLLKNLNIKEFQGENKVEYLSKEYNRIFAYILSIFYNANPEKIIQENEIESTIFSENATQKMKIFDSETYDVTSICQGAPNEILFSSKGFLYTLQVDFKSGVILSDPAKIESFTQLGLQEKKDILKAALCQQLGVESLEGLDLPEDDEDDIDEITNMIVIESDLIKKQSKIVMFEQVMDALQMYTYDWQKKSLEYKWTFENKNSYQYDYTVQYIEKQQLILAGTQEKFSIFNIENEIPLFQKFDMKENICRLEIVDEENLIFILGDNMDQTSLHVYQIVQENNQVNIKKLSEEKNTHKEADYIMEVKTLNSEVENQKKILTAGDGNVMKIWNIDITTGKLVLDKTFDKIFNKKKYRDITTLYLTKNRIIVHNQDEGKICMLE